jgi:hypothetical protein
MGALKIHALNRNTALWELLRSNLIIVKDFIIHIRVHVVHLKPAVNES